MHAVSPTVALSVSARKAANPQPIAADCMRQEVVQLAADKIEDLLERPAHVPQRCQHRGRLGRGGAASEVRFQVHVVCKSDLGIVNLQKVREEALLALHAWNRACKDVAERVFC